MTGSQSPKHRVALLVVAIVALPARCVAQEPATKPAMVVSQGRGKDDGDGSATAPFRTVTRALRAARETSRNRVVLEYGDYGAGETFPLEVPAGLELRGIGSGGTSLQVLTGVAVSLAASESAEPTVLAGLTIVGAEIGVQTCGAHPVLLRGVTIANCKTGIASKDGAATTIAATGLRLRECGVGIEAQGLAPITLQLVDSSFERCRVGLWLHAVDGGDPVAYAGPAPRHDLRLLRCTFFGCTQAGIERTGAVGKNTGPAYAIVDCTFQDNVIGIDLQRPSADTPLDVLRTRFLGNSSFGLRVSGQLGDAASTSSITGCDFQWNGIGVHATNAHVVYELRRCRFLDNVGNAMFLANFVTAPLTVRVADSLIAGNGGCGIYTMADGNQLAARITHCTIVQNGAAGVLRKTRHSGASTLEIRGCIVADNATDLERVAATEVFTSLVGDGSATSERGNLAGDPRFVSAASRDLRLRRDSPCIDRGDASSGAGSVDLAGRSRSGAPDLGALEAVPDPLLDRR